MKKIDLNLPLLPTTSVGSFPKPDYLKKARLEFKRKKINREQLLLEEQKATDFWIKTQEELGLDVLVDGEMNRGDMVAFFAENLLGFSQGGFVRSYGNRFYRKPVITGQIKWQKPITVESWQYAQNQTKKPIKGMLTGPYTIMDWSFIESYSQRQTACLALAKEMRQEVEALVKAGAKIIQIDEPAISVRPAEFELAKEAMQIMTDGFSKTYFITHICYGAFSQIYPKMLELAVENFDLEMSNSELDLLPLFKEHRFNKDISFGVVDVHSHQLESLELAKQRIRQALEIIDSKKIWIDPDCGLKTRSLEETIEKLKICVSAATEIRKEITS